MIIVKKLEVTSYKAGDSLHIAGDSIDVLLEKYIALKKLTKEDIIAININSAYSCYITHIKK